MESMLAFVIVNQVAEEQAAKWDPRAPMRPKHRRWWQRRRPATNARPAFARRPLPAATSPRYETPCGPPS